MNCDLLITNGTVATADAIYPADVAISAGKIAAILPPQSSINSLATHDATGC